MSEYKFVYETSIYHKLKVWTIFLLIIGVLLTISFFYFKNLIAHPGVFTSPFSSLTKFFNSQLESFTFFKLIYLSFLSELFFSPIPTEILFPISLKAGFPFFLTFSVLIVMVVFTNFVNYTIGEKLSSVIMQLISKKKVYEIRRWVGKYGFYAILLANMTPVLPSPALSFAVGLTKYNRTRLFTALLLGSGIKYLAIGGTYLFFK
ncbi:VTT domain-containing protein [Candidatus Pacearchaeota archaeon]|nr:VTT domain-containing protein [Candidatus Pacearchaeota archaeon]